MAQSEIPVKQLPIVMTVGATGDDDHIPTEQAVREAMTEITSAAAAKLYLHSVCI